MDRDDQHRRKIPAFHARSPLHHVEGTHAAAGNTRVERAPRASDGGARLLHISVLPDSRAVASAVPCCRGYWATSPRTLLRAATCGRGWRRLATGAWARSGARTDGALTCAA